MGRAPVDTMKEPPAMTRTFFRTGSSAILALFTAMFLLVTAVSAGGGGLPPVVTDLHITVGHSYDDDSYADFTFLTNQDAGSILAASTEPAISTVDFNEFAHVDAAVLQLAQTGPKHDVRLRGLLPNTRYYYVMIVEKANHQKTKVEGYFKTVGAQLDPGTNYNPINCTPYQEMTGTC